MLESCLLFLSLSALGIFAMAPSVTFGDSGEFAASAAVWGLPHAPGYPLYTVAAKALGTALPLGNWAYRTNLFSALAGAAALALLADALRAARICPTGRLGAVVALGLSPLWRNVCGVTEVFALHDFFLSALIWLVIRFAGRFWEDRPMAAFGLLCGLGMGNHQTLALAAPAALWEGLVSSSAPRARLLRGLAMAAFFFAVGLSAYLCLPLRSSHGPPLDWGHPVDVPRFLHVLLRKDYGSLSLTVEGQASSGRLAAAGAQALRFFDMARGGLGILVVLLALGGLGVWRLATVRVSPWFPALWVMFTGPFFLCLGNPPFDAQTSGALERFALAPCLGLAVLAAAALHLLCHRGRAARALALTLAVAAIAAGAWSRPRWWERGDFASYDYGRSVMRSLPNGSSLFMDGGDDTFYSLAFLGYAQGLRSDLDLHDRGGLVFANPYGPDFRRLDTEAKEARRRGVEASIAFDGRLYYSTFRTELATGYALLPWGLLKKAGDVPAADLWELYPYRWSEDALAARYRDRALIAVYPVLRGAELAARGRVEGIDWLRLAWNVAPDALWLKGNIGYILGMIGYSASQSAQWPLAERALTLERRINPEDLDSALNLGVVHEKQGRPEIAEADYKQAASAFPQDSRPYFNLGALFWSQKRWSQSAEAFEAAAARKPGDRALENWARQARAKAR